MVLWSSHAVQQVKDLALSWLLGGGGIQPLAWDLTKDKKKKKKKKEQKKEGRKGKKNGVRFHLLL